MRIFTGNFLPKITASYTQSSGYLRKAISPASKLIQSRYMEAKEILSQIFQTITMDNVSAICNSPIAFLRSHWGQENSFFVTHNHENSTDMEAGPQEREEGSIEAEIFYDACDTTNASELIGQVAPDVIDSENAGWKIKAVCNSAQEES